MLAVNLKRWFAYAGVRSVLILCCDAAATAIGIEAAWWLRFEGRVTPPFAAIHALTVPVVICLRLATLTLFGLHRWSFRLPGRPEAARLLAAQGVASWVFCLLVLVLERDVPRSIFPIEFLVSSVLIAGFRFGPDVFLGWRRERARLRAGKLARTLIYGAGEAGDLLARDIRHNPESRHLLVGFVDDDAAKVGTQLVGRPVLGGLEDVPALLAEYHITAVLVAVPKIARDRVRRLLDLCASTQTTVKILPTSFTEMDAQVAAAKLHDLAPEDLLPRERVVFDASEIRRQVEGRTVLVTGAGGSIGSEIARQLAVHGAGTLVLVDMNENELYLNSRLLAAEHPHVTFHAEVADVREYRRLRKLGERYRPQYLFHAAAHKHVPLLEDAPEEAVKNNVIGTRNAARMAIACGAQRFVLVSTDKAVNPTSVMGASKRIAEMVVRDLAHRTSTRMTSIRFGNVLGSAGSVIPIFKRQIERGGPVTLTHPDCTRYFMTIGEAVGLVLLAGIRCESDLCLLEMGSPMRILDLARNLITMTGHVPGEDIPIIFTGLRPGEKIREELLSEEEEETGRCRDGIRVAHSVPAPPRFREHLAALRSAALAGDSAAVLAEMSVLVPSARLGGAPERSQLRRHARRPAAIASWDEAPGRERSDAAEAPGP
ncbi:MAG: nucleoside-diphosphate sugar epimerase/dehydratase [Anaeromyxobacteraceae bacterium]